MPRTRPLFGPVVLVLDLGSRTGSSAVLYRALLTAPRLPLSATAGITAAATPAAVATAIPEAVRP